jgi:predicted nuclease of predicted toxin-antitoxin system
MSLKLLLDENLRHESIWSSLASRNRSSAEHLDVVRVGDEGMPPYSTADDELLAWAAAHNRIVVSLDERSLPAELARRRESGQSSPGIIFLRKNLPTPLILELLELVAFATARDEWVDACRWLP